MANRKKKPNNSNVRKQTEPKPIVIIQERTENKGAWIILITEVLKFLNLLWTELKEHIVELFSQL